MNKKCVTCGKEYVVPPYRQRSLSCSQKCHLERLHKLPVTKETREKMSLAHSDDKHHCWKGEIAGYHSQHSWVRRKKGRPERCAHCGKKNKATKDGRSWIHWANISGDYKRDLDDYTPLCVPCHSKFDKQRV